MFLELFGGETNYKDVNGERAIVMDEWERFYLNVKNIISFRQVELPFLHQPINEVHDDLVIEIQLNEIADRKILYTSNSLDDIMRQLSNMRW